MRCVPPAHGPKRCQKPPGLWQHRAQNKRVRAGHARAPLFPPCVARGGPTFALLSFDATEVVSHTHMERSGAQHFPQTRWSLVSRATATEPASAVQALNELLRVYWRPLWAFARRSGLSPEDAEDAVQGFCESLIERASLGMANAEQGRLRSFLLGGLQHHLRDVYRREQRLKRGGGCQFVSLDDPDLLQQPVSQEASPGLVYEQRWAYSLLEHVRFRLQEEFAARGRAEVFALLEPALAWNGGAMSYGEIAKALQSSEAAVQQQVKRMRQRYRTLLDEEILGTLADPADLEAERTHLIQILSGA